MVDVGARSDLECVFVAVSIILSSLINAQIFGEFANLTEILTRDQNNFRYNLTVINTNMARLKMSKDDQDLIRDYIVGTHKNKI